MWAIERKNGERYLGFLKEVIATKSQLEAYWPSCI